MEKTNLKNIKNNVEQASKKIKNNIEYTSKKIDSIMHNRLFLAIFMIIDGICFIMDPNDKMEFTAMLVVACVILTSCGVLITNLKSKYKDKKSIIIAIAMIIISIFIIMYPKVLTMNIRFLLAIFIIFNGLINIFNTLKLNNVSSRLSNTENKIKSDFDKYEKEIVFDNNETIMYEVEKVTNPLTNFIEKVSDKSVLYFILNGISIILGLFLFTTTNITLVVCGVILIYTGLSDLLIFLKSINLLKKLRIIKKSLR